MQAPNYIKEGQNVGSGNQSAGLSFPYKSLSKSNLKNNRFGSYLSSISEGDDVDLLTNNEELDSLMNPIIYHRGIRSDHFYLIITGRVSICSGNEGFISEVGTFEFLGEKCLTDS